MKRKLISHRQGQGNPPGTTTPQHSIEIDEESRPQAQSPRNTRNNRRAKKKTVVAILRKIVWLVGRGVQEPPSDNFFLDFIKDVAYGTLCGVFFILFLSFLDYRNIVSIRSGSRLRSAAYELISDPEWMKTIEESIDVRFIDLDIYNAIKKDIERGKAATDSEIGEYQRNVKQLEAKERELEIAKKAYDEALIELGANVERWCGDCMVSPWVTCVARLQYIMERYHDLPEKRLKENLMKDGMCFLPPS